MRILVTKLGDELIKLMAEEHIAKNNLHTTSNMIFSERNMTMNNMNSLSKTNNMLKTSHTRNKSNISNNSSYKNNRSKNSKFRSDQLTKLDQDQTKISAEDLLTSKVISIKQKKLNIPKNVTERYNSDNKNSFILPSVTLPKFKDHSNMNNLSMNNYNSTFNTTNGINAQRQLFSFRDILNDDTYVNLKKKLTKDRKVKDRLSRVDETKFRSTFGEKSEIENLDNMLSRNINPDRINLINYINKKNDLSDVLIKKLVEYSEDKINKANKICQIVFHNEERSHLFKERINERIQAKQNREKTEYKTTIEDMGNEIKSQSNILRDYEHNVNKRERFRDIHNEMVNKFWRKYKVQRFDKKSSSMNKTQSTMDEFNNINFNSLSSNNSEI